MGAVQVKGNKKEAEIKNENGAVGHETPIKHEKINKKVYGSPAHLTRRKFILSTIGGVSPSLTTAISDSPTKDGKVSLASVRKKMLEELKANRPEVSDKQREIIRSTWPQIKQEQHDMGLSMFAG